jgi:DNA repair exonuclease SbcCD ATPase subunit
MTGRHIEFQKITIKDFMSIGEAELPLASQGLTLIEGINKDDSTVESNGSGKSSVAEALLWCLYDKTSRGIKADEVIHRGAKKASVAVEFTVDGKQIVVSRDRTKGKPIARIVANGDDITPHDQKNATELIESIVGASFDQFLLMVVYAQGFETKFSSFNDSERKELLESYLGIEVYDQAKLLANNKLKEFKTDLANTERQGNISDSLITSLQSSLVSIDEARRKAAVDNKKERDTLEKVIAEMSVTLAGYDEPCALAKSVTLEVQEGLANLQREADAIKQRISKGSAMVSGVKSAIDKIQRQINSLASKCPTCGQDLPGDEYSVALASLTSELEAEQQKKTDYASFLSTLEEDLMQFRDPIAEQSALLEEAREHENSIKSEAQQVRAVIQEKQRQHAYMKPADTHYDDLFKETELKIQREKDILDTCVQNIETLNSTIHEYEYWSSAFDPTGIRSVILRNVVNSVNEYLNDLCATVTGNTFNVQLSSTKELKSKKEAINKLDIVLSPDGSYKGSSGGERRKIDLLLNIAISKFAKSMSNFSTNLIIADEVLDNLDLTASQHVLQMFSNITSNNDSILLISHNPSVKPLIPNVWTVVKQNGVSSVVM